MQRDHFMQILLESAQAEGLSEAECYLAVGDAFEATVHDGEILSYSVSSALGLSFRALVNGKMGYAATQVLDEAAIGQLIQGAKTNAQLIENDDAQFIYSGSAAYPDCESFNPQLESVTPERKLETALALEKAVRSIDPRVDQVEHCGLFSGRSFTRIVNTKGLDVSFESNNVGLFIMPIAKENERVNSAFKFVCTRDFEALSIADLAQSAAGAAIDGLTGEPVDSGDYCVMLSNEAASALLSTFVPVFSADAAQKGLSLLDKREGEFIANECVTLIDDPLHPMGMSGAAFDGEGVAARKKTIIENGVLKTLLHNLKTAAKAGVETTGNAARASYAASVGISPSNFFIAPGQASQEEMLQSVDAGLLICDLQGLHAGVDAVSGAFSLSAKGFMIENGQIGRAVSGITMAGNFFDMLKEIKMVGSDLWFSFPGISNVGSPSLNVGTLKIAGR